MNLADIVRVHARRMPGQMALIEGRQALDWQSLHARIEAAAWHLQANGARPSDVVAISLRSAVAQCIVALAVVRSGATACLLDWRARPGETANILDAISPRLLVCDRRSEGTPGTVVVESDERWAELPPGRTAPVATGDGDRPAFLLLSSGTTGMPKAVVISNAAMTWRAAVRMHEVSICQGMRAMCAIPLSGSAGLTGLVCQLLAGAATWFLPPMSSTSGLVELLLREGIEHTTLVPTTVRALLGVAHGPGPLLPGLARLVTLGAAFHAEEKQSALERLSPNLLDHYGAAGAGAIAFAGASEMASNPASVGRLALFTEIEIVDDAGRIQPVGAPGRIRVRSPTMATGYFRDTGRDEHDEIFQDGWGYPGDLGRLDRDGFLYLDGRAASVIIRGGQNLYPEEIERVLMAHPGVAEAAVVGRRDPLLGEEPVALVVARPTLDLADLARHCRTALQSVKVPVEFLLVEALPRTATGKVRRVDLGGLVLRRDAMSNSGAKDADP